MGLLERYPGGWENLEHDFSSVIFNNICINFNSFGKFYDDDIHASVNFTSKGLFTFSTIFSHILCIS